MRFGTVTVKLWDTLRPPEARSWAVTVTVAVPTPTAVIVKVLPLTLSVAMLVADDLAVYRNVSSSGSLNLVERPIPSLLPTVNLWFPICESTTGGLFGTVTVKLWDTLRPPEARSWAVTVTVAVPTPTAVIVKVLPLTLSVATLVADDLAVYRNVSSSGSLNLVERPIPSLLPTVNLWFPICESTTGGLFGTVTVKLWDTLRPPEARSWAVTVTVAVPTPTAVIVKVLPLTLSVATLVADDLAVYRNVSSSGSLNLVERPIPSLLPTVNLWFPICESTTGGLFGTVTVKLWDTLRPPEARSWAVTVTVAVPTPTAVIVKVLPLTLSVATLVADDLAVYRNVSSSGSLNLVERPIPSLLPTVNLWFPICESTTGGLFGTVTVKLWDTLRPPEARSWAVTVTVAVPTPTAVIVKVLPLTLSVAMLVADDLAVYRNVSSSGSLNLVERPIPSLLPTVNLWFPICESTTGGLFGRGLAVTV